VYIVAIACDGSRVWFDSDGDPEGMLFRRKQRGMTIVEYRYPTSLRPSRPGFRGMLAGRDVYRHRILQRHNGLASGRVQMVGLMLLLQSNIAFLTLPRQRP